MISESKFSKQAELDFMHNFRHDTEGDRWAKHEIESLRQQVASFKVITKSMGDHGQQRKKENDELRQQVAGWIKANSPGGWIDDLRQQVTLLRDELDRIANMDDGYGEHVCCDSLIGKPHSEWCNVWKTLCAMGPKP